jgi:hypothetical protein
MEGYIRKVKKKTRKDCGWYHFECLEKLFIRVCDNGSTTGASCETGTDYHPEAREFTPGF